MMRTRPLIIATALLSAVLGAVAAYLVLTVPNDIQAGALLRQAREDIASGKNDRARDSLARVVQQYPRTDAAAAATVALARLLDDDRIRLKNALAREQTENARQTRLILDLQRAVQEIKSVPPKTTVVVQKAPPPAPARTPPRKPTRRTRRRR